MRKMLFAALSMLVLIALPINAVAAKYAVVDQAELLDRSERLQLESQLEQVSQKHEIDIVVLTVDSLNGKSAMAYADDYYDDSGYADDGVLLLVCMESRQWWISTAGKCIDRLVATDFEENLVADLSVGNYYDAFTGFARECDRQMAVSPAAVLVCILIGAAVGLIVVLVMKSKMKTVRSQSGADGYVSNGQLHLTGQSDIFLYQTVTRRPKPQGGSGGSHIGSSGRSHGGGGGRF